jgi:ribosomal protein S18 acetylase RimI-like enzyme
MEHPMNIALLDRPVWNALSTRQTHHALGGGDALRFDPSIGPFSAVRDHSPESLAALASLAVPGETLMMAEAGETPPPPGFAIEAVSPGVQMVLDALVAPLAIEAVIEPLDDRDAAQMLALATLTQPGPFRERTHKLGDFWGIRHDGRLVAMAGERMRVAGLTEVSGVCSHPDARGRGYAGALSHHVSNLILARGETPFLHAWAGNANAIRLYETLGFKLRSEMIITVLRRL